MRRSPEISEFPFPGLMGLDAFMTIPQHYPVEAGALFGGEYPGAIMPALAEARLQHLIGMGVRTFLDLTAPEDGLVPYEDLLQSLSEQTNTPLQRISLPIRDMDIPDSPETMRSIMDAIRTSIERAPAVYGHCWGGIGRTGTVVGCWLRECGIDPEAALLQVHKLYTGHMPKSRRIPDSPQTRGQRDYVLR